MGSPGSLFVAIIMGAIGTGYFIYGKRQSQFMPMISGAALCVYPYFVSNVLVSLIVGGMLLLAPFIWKF
jgi:hypothetical protein